MVALAISLNQRALRECHVVSGVGGHSTAPPLKAAYFGLYTQPARARLAFRLIRHYAWPALGSRGCGSRGSGASAPTPGEHEAVIGYQ